MLICSVLKSRVAAFCLKMYQGLLLNSPFILLFLSFTGTDGNFVAQDGERYGCLSPGSDLTPTTKGGGGGGGQGSRRPTPPPHHPQLLCTVVP